MEKIVNTKFSKTVTHIHLAIVGIFYLVSGFWEIIIGIGESDYSLPNSYRNYQMIVGVVTILIGLGFLIRVRFLRWFIRLAVLALAWWNIFAAPLAQTWYYARILVRYPESINIKNSSSIFSWFGFWAEVMIVPVISILIRLYIIYILKPQRAGYLFLKDEGDRANV